MTHPMDIAGLAIRKYLLQCQVATPKLAHLSPSTKVIQKVRLLDKVETVHRGSTAHIGRHITEKRTYQSNKQQTNTQEPKERAVHKILDQGSRNFAKGNHAVALERFNEALPALKQSNTLEYYKILSKKAQVLKRLHKTPELYSVYADLSLRCVGE